MPELHYSTLTDLATRIATREISPVEVIERMLDRIHRVDADFHAYVTVTSERARRQADEAEKALTSGAALGPLFGVPIAVKDLCDTEGIETTAGMPLFAGRVPDKNATVVQRLLDAGAILLGKLKTTEGAGILHHPTITAPLNPWNPARWSGASSSGSGVATAAGLCFGSIGTDTAGSIRFPSACNALVGLKPTFGRVPTDGVFPLAPSLDHVGPMTRSVRDTARMFGVLADPAEGESASVSQGRIDIEGELAGGAKGLTIGFDEDYCTRNVDSTLARAVAAAAKHLESLGATLRPVRIQGIDEALDAFAVIFHSEAARVHAPYREEHEAKYGPHLRGIAEIGESMTDADRAEAQSTRVRFQQQLVTLLGTVDALLCPPAMTAPPPVEAMQEAPADFRLLAMALRYTAPYDLAGVPSLTLPCGFADENVPLALQLVGAPLEEARLLRIGQAYEESTEWHRRHPAL